jgi:exodeoxyribonuclease VII small subunit
MSEKQYTYEEALDRLKAIVGKLEQKQVKIDELADTVQEAKKLVDFCREKLDKTESEINKIIRPEE